MFRTSVVQTPLTTGIADTILGRITGQSYSDDVSFIATLRALVYPRLTDEECVSVRYQYSDYSASAISGNHSNRVMSAIFDASYMSRGEIVIHSIANPSADSNKANFNLIESQFCQVYNKFARLEKVTAFFIKSFYCLCYVNASDRQVVLFVENLNLKKLHYIQCAIFAFMPWYFDPQKGVTADEMELIQSLREAEPDKYLNCLQKIAEKYDFRTESIKQKLQGFESRFDRLECERVQNEIHNVTHRLNELDSKIAQHLVTKRDLEIKLLGLETKIASNEGSSDIMDYFLCNKKLILRDVNDRDMTFVVTDYITYFDEDMAQSMIDNSRSYVYVPNGRACNNYITAEDMKRLMNAIFIDQTLRIRVCAAYQFVLGERVYALQDYSFGHECSTYIPNTHINRYRCLGSYEMEINRCVRNNDYIGAIEQCVASCKSLNFADSTVMKLFMEQMYGLGGYTNNRCVEMPDGSVLTPKEAAKYLREQEEKRQAEELAAQQARQAVMEDEEIDELFEEDFLDEEDEDE